MDPEKRINAYMRNEIDYYEFDNFITEHIGKLAKEIKATIMAVPFESYIQCDSELNITINQINMVGHNDELSEYYDYRMKQLKISWFREIIEAYNKKSIDQLCNMMQHV
jgi:hypothetical protein